jgi:hypothetical protein
VVDKAESATHDVQTIRDGREGAQVGVVENKGLLGKLIQMWSPNLGGAITRQVVVAIGI